jgi:hypothetical protein
MKNHGVRIMYDLQLLSPVPCPRRCVMEDLQFNSKHPVAMNSMFLDTIPLSAQSVINSRCYALILSAKLDSYSRYKFSRRPRLIELSI